jgi:GntR family transcriptional regulator/MocR family aminotransferase
MWRRRWPTHSAKNPQIDQAKTVPIVLDPADTAPLYLQIASRLRAAVAAGTLSAGARLPSARTLAAQLGITRGTVDAAYALLAGEGSIEARGSAGTIVSPHMAAWSAPPAQRSMKLGNRRPAIHAEPLPFRMGLPALDAFPRKLWSATVARAARATGPAELVQPDPAGFRGLREAIAAYLGLSRGIQCVPDQILVTGGFQGALALVRSVLLRPGDAVWVEDPGYIVARQALELAGASLVPVPIDRDGMRVHAGIIAAPRARLAIVTPTHQSPLGVALSLPRRLALLAWATEAGAWVLEDDYDSEFRYTGHPLPALKSLDRGERVVFAGSFSKVLFPGLRLGYLVVPELLTDAFLRASRLLSFGQASLEQRAVAAFMEQGHFARHLRRMRGLYADRRQALAASLRSTFGERLELELEAGGMHLLARFPTEPDDGAIVRRAVAVGLAPTALSGLTMAHDCGRGLLLGFTNVPETEAVSVVSRLAAVIGG